MSAARVALVTGGSRGLGKEMVKAFAAVGAHVVIADIEPARCEETARRVRALGRKALAIPTDVMDTDQIRAMLAGQGRLALANTYYLGLLAISARAEDREAAARVAVIVLTAPDT